MWIPKVNDKIDFRPAGDPLFVPAVVKQLTKLDVHKFAEIEYTIKPGEVRRVYIEYPHKDFLQCGKGIVYRKDCDL